MESNNDGHMAVTSGDVPEVIYWQTKFAALKLAAALKSNQPDYAIRGIRPSVVIGCADVLKIYPNHGEVKKWMADAREIEKKIDANAAPADFSAAFGQWRDFSYASGWRSYHLAKIAAASGDWAGAYTHAHEAGQHLGRLTGRMAAWPTDTQAWIKAAQTEMRGLQEEASSAVGKSLTLSGSFKYDVASNF